MGLGYLVDTIHQLIIECHTLASSSQAAHKSRNCDSQGITIPELSCPPAHVDPQHTAIPESHLAGTPGDASSSFTHSLLLREDGGVSCQLSCSMIGGVAIT